MKSTTLASLVIAGGIAANVLALDNTVIDSWLTNHIYCPARYVIEGFDRTDIDRVDVAVYIDRELDKESKENVSRASSGVWDEYFREFGISLQMREPVEIDVPEKAYTYQFEVLSDDDDITIVFTNKKCWDKGGTSVGYSDSIQNVVYVHSEYYSAEGIRNVLIHELGHLFYASHTNDTACYMYGSANYYLNNVHWCEDERNTIRMFKHKIW